MTKHPSEEKLEALVLRAIEQRNAASCYEIVRRKIAAGKSLREFLITGLGGHMPGASAATAEDGDVVPGEIDADTIDLIMKATDTVDIDTSDDPDPICCLAREMLKFNPPYLGQNLDKKEKAESYIYMAADSPRIGAELPRKMHGFWRAAAVGYRSWKAMNRRKVS